MPIENEKPAFSPEQPEDAREDIGYWRQKYNEYLEFGSHDHQRVYDFAAEILKRHPDARDYAMFHLLIGSSPADRPKFDFEGEDSIRAFLRQLTESAENR